MFPNFRLLIVAVFASIVALSCGFGVFAAFRVSHAPLARLRPTWAPLQLAVGNASPLSMVVAETAPLDHRRQTRELHRGGSGTTSPATVLDRRRKVEPVPAALPGAASGPAAAGKETMPDPVDPVAQPRTLPPAHLDERSAARAVVPSAAKHPTDPTNTLERIWQPPPVAGVGAAASSLHARQAASSPDASAQAISSRQIPTPQHASEPATPAQAVSSRQTSTPQRASEPATPAQAAPARDTSVQTVLQQPVQPETERTAKSAVAVPSAESASAAPPAASARSRDRQARAADMGKAEEPARARAAREKARTTVRTAAKKKGGRRSVAVSKHRTYARRARALPAYSQTYQTDVFPQPHFQSALPPFGAQPAQPP